MSKKTYKDPLHVPNAELVVWHKDKEHLLLNKSLLDQQNCWKNLEKIKKLHQKRLLIEDKMAELDIFLDLPEDIKILNDEWVLNQIELQKAWGFPEDYKFHRFWDIPACSCPKMDNNERYPTGYYIQSGNCRLHGSHMWKKDKT